MKGTNTHGQEMPSPSCGVTFPLQLNHPKNDPEDDILWLPSTVREVMACNTLMALLRYQGGDWAYSQCAFKTISKLLFSVLETQVTGTML